MLTVVPERAGHGTSATSVVPAPGRRLDRQPAADERDPLAHADEAERPRPASPRLEAPSVVLDHDDRRSPPCARAVMLTRAAARVLHDVRQRLLHDPVERRLDLGRQAVARRAGPRRRRRARTARPGSPRAARRRARDRSRRARSGAARPRAGGRPAASRRRARGAPRWPRAPRRSRSTVVEVLEAEQDRRERLAGLVVQLAGEPRALELLRLDDAAQRVAAHALGEVDGDRRPRGERLGEADVVLRRSGDRRRACRATATTPIGVPRTISGT